MATKEYAIRLSVDRANEVRAAFRGIGTEGASAFLRVGDAADKAGREVGGMRAEAARTGPALKSLEGAAAGLRGHLIGILSIGAIAAIGKQAIEAADKFSAMRSSLALVVRQGEDLLQIERDLGAASLRNNSDLQGTIALYGRMRQARKDLTDERAQKAVDSWNKTLIVSGSSATEAASATLQFSQALGGGALRGAELNSVIAGNIRGAQLFADTLGIGLGQLKTYGEQGKITSAVLLKALTEDTEKLKKEFDAIALTTDKAGTNLDTAWTRAVGTIDKATGATKSLAGGLNWIADNVNNLTVSFGHSDDPAKKLAEQLAAIEKQIASTDRAVQRAGFGPYAKSAKDAMPALTAFEQRLAAIQTRAAQTGEAVRNAAVGDLSLSRRELRNQIEGIEKELARFYEFRTHRQQNGDPIAQGLKDYATGLEGQLKIARAQFDAAGQRINEILKTPLAGFADPNVMAEAIGKWGKIVEDSATPVQKARKALADFNAEAAKFPDAAAYAEPARAVLVKALKDAEAASKASTAAKKDDDQAAKAAADAQAKWAGVVEQAYSPAQRLRAQVAELNDDYYAGKLGIAAYINALDALSTGIADAEKTARDASPAFVAIADARERIKDYAEAQMSAEQRLAAEQERLGELVGQNGFTAEEAAKALAAYANSLEKVDKQAGMAAVGQDLFNEAVSGGIQSMDDLEDVALRALASIALKWVETAQTMKAANFGDFLAAMGSAALGGGRARAVNSYSPTTFSTPDVSRLPATMPSPVYHDGGVIGPRAASRVVSLDAFRTARRHHSGLWPGMYPGERAIIAQDGERMFSRMHNERIVRAVERGGEGSGLQVQIINNAGADVQARETRGADGQRRLQVTINRMQRQAIASGAMDEVMRQRYGVRPAQGG